MRIPRRSGFLRPFIGGFALGAVALLGVQLTRDEPPATGYVASAVVTPV